MIHQHTRSPCFAGNNTRCFHSANCLFFKNQYWGLVKCQSWDHVDSGTRHQASAPSNPPPGTAPLSLTTLLPWAPDADKTQSGIEPRSPAVKGHGTAGLSLAGSRAGAPQLLLEAGQVGLVQTAHKILITLWRTEQFIKHYGAFNRAAVHQTRSFFFFFSFFNLKNNNIFWISHKLQQTSHNTKTKKIQWKEKSGKADDTLVYKRTLHV